MNDQIKQALAEIRVNRWTLATAVLVAFLLDWLQAPTAIFVVAVAAVIVAYVMSELRQPDVGEDPWPYHDSEPTDGMDPLTGDFEAGG